MYRSSLKVEIFKEGDVYVALCPELNVSSFGESLDSAKQSVREAIRAFLEECEKMGTLEEVLEEAGFIKQKDMWISREPIVEEKIALSC